MVQLAESVKQVKAMRNSTSAKRELPVFFQQLKTRLRQRTVRSQAKRYDALSQIERDDVVFAGKEFLVSFDPSIRLQDIWLTGFELACLNHLREDLEFR